MEKITGFRTFAISALVVAIAGGSVLGLWEITWLAGNADDVAAGLGIIMAALRAVTKTPPLVRHDAKRP